MTKLRNFVVILAFGLALASNDYPKCHKSNLQWFPHQTECNSYFLCHHGKAIQRYCAPELHFNNSTGQCMLPQSADCTLKCPVKDDPANPIFLPDFKDCSKFFICYNGIAIHRSCASGLKFDTENNWCNFEEFVQCGYREDGDGNEVPNGSTVITEVTTELPVTQTPSNITKMNCPLETGPLYFPHPARCDRYFRCYMGISFLENCPAGLEYDQLEKRCRTEANCSARNPPL